MPKPKIISKTQNNKVSTKPLEVQGCCSEQYPWFSLRYMTKNDRYSLEGLNPGKDRENTLANFYARLVELSTQPWMNLVLQPKKNGLETITYDQLRFEADPQTNLTKDTTIYIFRFDTSIGTGKGRIIGFKKSPCAVLHIIGCDFDYSAYDHGK